jgi:hypothetical protein
MRRPRFAIQLRLMLQSGARTAGCSMSDGPAIVQDILDFCARVLATQDIIVKRPKNVESDLSNGRASISRRVGADRFTLRPLPPCMNVRSV